MAEAENERTSGLLMLYVISQIVGLLSVLLVFYWCIVYSHGFGLSGNSLFSWHPLFMTIGLIYLMGNAIVTYRVFRNRHKRSLKLLHAIVNGVGLILTLIAAIAVLSTHLINNQANFYTLHSWIGIIAVVVYILQATFGLLMYLLDTFPPNQKAAFMPLHVYFGHFIFIAAIAAAFTGLQEKAIWTLGNDYAMRVSQAWIFNGLGILFFVYGALIVYISTNSNYKRYPRPEDTQLIERSPDS